MAAVNEAAFLDDVVQRGDQRENQLIAVLRLVEVAVSESADFPRGRQSSGWHQVTCCEADHVGVDGLVAIQVRAEILVVHVLRDVVQVVGGLIGTSPISSVSPSPVWIIADQSHRAAGAEIAESQRRIRGSSTASKVSRLGLPIGHDDHESFFAVVDHRVFKPTTRCDANLRTCCTRRSEMGCRFHRVGHIRRDARHPVGVDLEERLGERRAIGTGYRILVADRGFEL